MRSLLPVLLGVSLAACTVGDLGDDSATGDDSSTGDDTSGGDDTVTPTPKVAVAMTPPSIESELGTIDNDFTITVTGSDGFSGPVALAFSGVPEDWNAAFDLSTVNVPLDGTATAVLNVRVPPDAIGATANIQITATSTAAAATLATPGVLTIANQYTIVFPAGTGEGNHLAFPADLQMHAGATLRFVNEDGTAHQIHTGDVVFPHGGEIPAAGNADITLEATGMERFYCHLHGEGLGATNFTVIP